MKSFARNPDPEMHTFRMYPAPLAACLNATTHTIPKSTDETLEKSGKTTHTTHPHPHW
jgi:hypothetical protein